VSREADAVMHDEPIRVETDPRFSRRRRAVERGRRRRTFIRLGVVAVLAGIAWAAFYSPLLGVREVAVVGAHRTGRADVVRAVGLNENDNVLLISTAEVRRRVLELPWVKSAEIDRVLPGTVKVTVTERRPAVILSLGAARWTIDARGRVLASGVAGRGLPILAGVQVGVVEPGITLRTSESTAALAVLRALPRAIGDEVVGVFAPTTERITLTLADGTQVRYGAPERRASKNEVLAAVLARLRGEGTVATYIDVRVPERPAVLGADDRAPNTETAAPASE
jgi:cell division protein FtsQ